MITIEDALRIAIEAHEGQKDLDGNPVILHPLTVGLAGHNREEIVAGLLHDVVEDTDFTFEELLKRGVDESIVDALQLLTHSKDIPYNEYVEHIAQSGNDVAIHVKYNDLCHNLKRGRAGGHWKIVSKHEKALAIIEPLVQKCDI
ncbi:MAG: HD domain-containing protein [Bacteroidaceae bacterium]|nr:HD domain-containing protein [Bacteroidaceae bacterium]